ncbi:hypothetical protein H6501_04905 [Candidatus Woesearchaeota archaeon]|nr:hypothetical protein [Nanoarchaeota archaeon]MCB9370912.1 hypothetical protein [Candidatus Woesearchaeota archaeon]USN44013.1 MAG: hypothetical protein H6500_06510 [Candidatus Woesearchaeota archaeon]
MEENNFKQLNAEEKVTYVIGHFLNYTGYLETLMINSLKKSRPDFNNKDPNYSRILEGFEQRVSQQISEPGFKHGGNVLDHLPQGQQPILTQEEYLFLYSMACHAVGTIFQELNFASLASKAYSLEGTLRSQAKKSNSLLKTFLR